VDNRAGAGGNIAHDMAAKAAPDGYTMVLASVASLAMSPGLLGKLPYDPISDFSPVAQLVDVTCLLSVHPSSASRTLKDFVARAKQQPGTITVANPGTGSIAHLAFELFKATAGIRVVNVPYKGGGPAVIDALSGQVETLAGVISTGAPHVKAGKLRGLGVTSLKRSPALPDVPTIAESGVPGYEATSWNGMFAPAKTPRAIIEKLHAEVVKALHSPDVREKLVAMGSDPVGSMPEQFHSFIKQEHARWGKVIRENNIRAE